MDDILLTSELRAQGIGKPEIVRLVQRRELERIRRGAFTAPVGPDEPVERRHRRALAATIPFLTQGAVISHGSAAVLHGLPVWPDAIARVHVTRSRSTGGKRRRLVHVHVAPLAAGDVVVRDGVLLTSVARTVLDVARTLPFAQAVAAGDHALALGLPAEELCSGLLGMAHWPGVRQARRAEAFLDPRSESPGESASRVRLADQGLPAPTLQLEIFDANGHFVGRCDFGWEEHRTVGEFDGRAKYDRLLRPGQRVEEVVYAEKLREDALRDLGWQVVRWTWDDLSRPELIRDRLMRAFARTAPATSHPGG